MQLKSQPYALAALQLPCFARAKQPQLNCVIKNRVEDRFALPDLYK